MIYVNNNNENITPSVIYSKSINHVDTYSPIMINWKENITKVTQKTFTGEFSSTLTGKNAAVYLPSVNKILLVDSTYNQSLYLLDIDSFSISSISLEAYSFAGGKLLGIAYNPYDKKASLLYITSDNTSYIIFSTLDGQSFNKDYETSITETVDSSGYYDYNTLIFSVAIQKMVMAINNHLVWETDGAWPSDISSFPTLPTHNSGDHFVLVEMDNERIGVLNRTNGKIAIYSWNDNALTTDNNSFINFDIGSNTICNCTYIDQFKSFFIITNSNALIGNIDFDLGKTINTAISEFSQIPSIFYINNLHLFIDISRGYSKNFFQWTSFQWNFSADKWYAYVVNANSILEIDVEYNIVYYTPIIINNTDTLKCLSCGDWTALDDQYAQILSGGTDVWKPYASTDGNFYVDNNKFNASQTPISFLGSLNIDYNPESGKIIVPVTSTNNDTVRPGQIFTSVDGINWSLSSLPATGSVEAVAYKNGTWFIGYYRDSAGQPTTTYLLSNDDGETWTNHNFNTAYRCRCATVFDNKFYVGFNNIANNNIIYAISNDGIEWTTYISSYATNINHWCIGGNTNPQKLFGVSYSSSSTYYIMIADNGIEHVPLQYPTVGLDYRQMVYSRKLNLYVLVGRNVAYNKGYIFTNPDASLGGAAWTLRLTTSVALNNVEWSDDLGIFIATSDHNSTYYISEDGINWTAKTFSNSFEVCCLKYIPTIGKFILGPSMDHNYIYSSYTYPNKESTVATVVFNVGSHGTTQQTSITVNKGTAIGQLPEVVVNDGYIFEGWYTTDNYNAVLVSEDFIVEHSMTLYARYYSVLDQIEVIWDTNNSSITIPNTYYKIGSEIGQFPSLPEEYASSYYIDGVYTAPDNSKLSVTTDARTLVNVTDKVIPYDIWNNAANDSDLDGNTLPTYDYCLNNDKLVNQKIYNTHNIDSVVLRQAGPAYNEIDANISANTTTASFDIPLWNPNLTTYTYNAINDSTLPNSYSIKGIALCIPSIIGNDANGKITVSIFNEENGDSDILYSQSDITPSRNWKTIDISQPILITDPLIRPTLRLAFEIAESESTTMVGIDKIMIDIVGPDMLVKFDAGSHGSSAETSMTFERGTAITLPSVTANKGYIFNGWYTEQENGIQINDGYIITENLVLYAHYEIATVTINFDAGEKGTASFTSKTVNIGEPIGKLPTVSMTSSGLGYKFNGWYTAESGGTQITEDTIISDENGGGG